MSYSNLIMFFIEKTFVSTITLKSLSTSYHVNPIFGRFAKLSWNWNSKSDRTWTNTQSIQIVSRNRSVDANSLDNGRADSFDGVSIKNNTLNYNYFTIEDTKGVDILSF